MRRVESFLGHPRRAVVTLTFFALATAAGQTANGQSVEGFTPVDGLELHYQVVGEGQALLLINGGPGWSSAHMLPVAERLAESYRVILFDQRGTGESTLAVLDSTTVTMSAMIEDVEALRRHLGIDSWIVMGHSFGGMLAMAYAAAHPQPIEALLLSAPAGPTLDFMSYYPASLNDRLLPEELEAVAHWSDPERVAADPGKASYEIVKASIGAFLYDRSHLDEILAVLDEETWSMATSQLVWSDLMRTSFDVSEPLRTFERPVLVVQGRQDALGTLHAHRVAQLFPRSTLEIIEESAHLMWVDQEDRYYDLVLGFLGTAMEDQAAMHPSAYGSTPTPDRLTQKVFDLVELAPGVYAADVVSRPPVYAFANSLIVIGENGVLVVDTQQSPGAARALIAEIRRLTDAPVRWVVNTHSHADHVYGNEAYRDAFPEVEFIAHENVAAELTERGRDRLKKEMAELPATIEARRHWLEEGRGPDGDSLDEEGRAAIRYSLRHREAYLDELETLKLIGPTRTFDRLLQLRVGGREVRLLHFGNAHTKGDAVVYLPAEGIVATGDLIENGFPYFGDAFPAGWAAVLDSIAALDAGTFVPGHGPVQHGRGLLSDDAELLETIAAYARAAVEAGTSREETLASVHVSPPLLRRFEEEYGVSEEAFESGFREAVGRAFDELSGGNEFAQAEIVIHRGDQRPKWQTGPSGAAFASLYGDPTKPEAFAFLMKMPADWTMQPHVHNTGEYLTVLSGVLYMKFESDNGWSELPTGSVIAIPAGAPMWAKTEGSEVVLEVSGTGPFRTRPIEEE